MKDAGMDVESDKAYAAQLLGDVEDVCGRRPHAAEMKDEYQGKIGAKLETLLQ